MAPDLDVWAQASAHRDCHAQFEKSLYSVPLQLVDQKLWLRATDNTVTAFRVIIWRPLTHEPVRSVHGARSLCFAGRAHRSLVLQSAPTDLDRQAPEH